MPGQPAGFCRCRKIVKQFSSYSSSSLNKPSKRRLCHGSCARIGERSRAPRCSARAWLDTLFGSYCCVGARSASRRSNAARGRPCRKPPSHSPNVAGRETIAPLISALKQPSVRIRFWAVFASDATCLGNTRVVQALELMLDDHDVLPGNCWSVGKEALAMLGSMRSPVVD